MRDDDIKTVINHYQDRMVDLTSPESVEIKLDYTASGLALWVNVDGRCALRIYGIDQKTMSLEDNRVQQ